jgi:uncharacterized protein YndB with AHSA1/START domain
MSKSSDRIEKKVLLKAPRSRVWRAIADAREFSSWFGVDMVAPFVAGERAVGRVTVKGYEHLPMEIWVDRVEPEHYFSYRWHPFAIDAGADYSKEPTTLVELELAEVDGGTEVTIIESGFDAIPAARRADAFRANNAGWDEQAENIRRHVAS